MLVRGAYEKAKLYLDSRGKEKEEKFHPGACITISRQTGAGADAVSEYLVDFLQPKNTSATKWTIFYKNLIEKVLEEHNFPAAIKDLMKETRYSHVNNLVTELLAGYPGHYTLEHRTAETILRLAGMGNVIIVGRGASIITARLKNTFHIRLVAPFEDRVKHVQEVYGISDKTEAAEFTRRQDAERQQYIKFHFHKNIEDTSLYNMVLNTGSISYKVAAEIIGGTVQKIFPEYFN